MSEQTQSYWYVSDRGKSFGPYTSEMVVDRIGKETFSTAALVWKDGLNGWQPISVHFSFQRGPVPLPGIESVPAPVPSVELEPIPERRQFANPPWRWISAIGAATLLALVWFVVPGNEIGDPATFLFLRIGELLTGIALAAFSGFLWWKYSKSKLAKPLTVFGGIGALIVSIMAISTTPLLYRIISARQLYNRYQITTDPVTQTVQIKGTIGPGLDARLRHELSISARIKTVEIDSPGGLVDEALSLASTIQSLNLDTRAIGTCNSSCIIVFMSGRERIAPRSLKFGFHAVGEITRVTGAYNIETLADIGKKSDAYLRSRGIPEKFLAQTKKAGKDALEFVSAIDLAESGAVTLLIDAGGKVALADARWREILDELKRAKIQAEVIDLFTTIGNADSEAVEKFSLEIWGQTKLGNFTAVQGAVRSLVAELTTKAIPAASDAAVRDSIKVTGRELALLREQARWDICSMILNGKGFGGFKLPPDIMAADYRSSAGLVRSAAANNWKPRDLQPWVDQRARTLIQAVHKRLLTRGVDVVTHTDPRTSCEWATELANEVAVLPETEAAPIWRWVASQK